MPLDKQQVKQLLSSVADTREDEIDCDACLARLAEFAEVSLVGAEISDALERIRTHLSLCPECAEEFEILLEVLRTSSAIP